MCVEEKVDSVTASAIGQQMNNDNGNSRNGLLASENTLTIEPPEREESSGETIPDSGEGRMETGGERNKMKWLRAQCIDNWWMKGVGIILSILICFLVGYLFRDFFGRDESSSAPCPSCPPGWIGSGIMCYYFSKAESDWNSSQSNCTSYGASLATISTKEELDFVTQILKPAYHWLGLQRKANQPWRWANGSVFNSSLFQIGEHGECAYLKDDGVSSTWCSSIRYWICSKSLSTS